MSQTNVNKRILSFSHIYYYKLNNAGLYGRYFFIKYGLKIWKEKLCFYTIEGIVK